MAADHVIIGGGINGLVCAAMLAKAGHEVLLLERSAQVGGCMRSAELAPGFNHDVMAATFVLFITGPAFSALGEDLKRHGFELANGSHPTGALRPDGSSAVLTTDRSANVAAFNALAPGDGKAHAAAVGEIEKNAPLLFGLLGGELWSTATARMIAREAWRRGPRGLAAFLGEQLAPARGWLETAYKSPQLQALFAPWTLHCGLSPEDAYSGAMAKIVAFALEAAGAPVAKGGAGQAALAFRRLIEAQGGTVRTNAEVERILVRNNRAAGVRLVGGEEITAKHVVASLATRQLYGSVLSEAAPSEARAAAEKFRLGRANFQLNYALSRPPRWIAPGLEKVALLHLTDGIDAVSKSHNEATRGMLPETPTICVGQPSALDPSRAPEGGATLWIQVPDAPRLIKGDAAGAIPTTGHWDEAAREAFADRIEAILARHMEGFGETVVARRAYGPADLERMNANLVGGDPYGGACTIDQFFLWRGPPGSTNHRTPIRNLYHIGASTHPGPGLSGGSGYLVAKELT